MRGGTSYGARVERRSPRRVAAPARARLRSAQEGLRGGQTRAREAITLCSSRPLGRPVFQGVGFGQVCVCVAVWGIRASRSVEGA